MSPRKGSNATKKATRSRIESTGESYAEGRRHTVVKAVPASHASILKRFADCRLGPDHFAFDVPVARATGTAKVSIMIFEGARYGGPMVGYVVTRWDSDRATEGSIFFLEHVDEGRIAAEMDSLLSDHEGSKLFLDWWHINTPEGTSINEPDLEYPGNRRYEDHQLSTELLRYMMLTLDGKPEVEPFQRDAIPNQYHPTLDRFTDLGLDVFRAAFQRKVTVPTRPYSRSTTEGLVKYPGGDREVTVSMVIVDTDETKKVYMVTESNHDGDGVSGLIFYIHGSAFKVDSKLDALIKDHRESGLFAGWLYGRHVDLSAQSEENEVNSRQPTVSDVRLLDYMMEQLEPRTKKAEKDPQYSPYKGDYPTDLEYYSALSAHAEYKVKVELEARVKNPPALTEAPNPDDYRTGTEYYNALGEYARLKAAETS